MGNDMVISISLHNKQMAGFLAKDSVLLVLAAVECVCTKKHLYEKNIS